MTAKRIVIPFTRLDLPEAMVAAEAAADGGADEVVAVRLDSDPDDRESFAPAVQVVDILNVGVSEEELGYTIASLGVGNLYWASLAAVVSGLAGPDDKTVVLKPSTLVVGDLQQLWETLDSSNSVVIPTLLDPSFSEVPELRTGLLGDPPSAPAQLAVTGRVGAVNSSVFGFTADGKPSLLDRWPAVVGVASHFSPGSEDEFQAWLDSSALDDDVFVLRSPGLGVGYFNMRERFILDEAGEPHLPDVRLLDLRDHDPRIPGVIAPGQYVGFVSDAPQLAPTLGEYSASLLGAGWQDPPDPREASPEEMLGRAEGRWSVLPSGIAWTPPMRRLFRSRAAEGQLMRSPFTLQGEQEALREFSRPAVRGAADGVNRLMFSHWLSNPEVQHAYPVLDGADGPGFLGWIWVYGRPQELFPEELLPPWSEPLPQNSSAAAAEDKGESSRLKAGVNLAGYMSTEIGLGESARLIKKALQAVDVPVTAVQGRLMPVARHGAKARFVSPSQAKHRTNLLVINGDGLPEFARDVGREFFRNRYTIAFWWWEVDPYPEDHWNLALPWLDEIWVGTRFVYELVAPHVDVPVFHMTTPVATPPEAEFNREHFGLSDEEFTFLYVFNYQSAGERKNPLGLVRAYREAFEESDGCRLVLKCVGCEYRVEEHESVKVAALGRGDITIISDYLDAEERDALVSLCDCYVSPHRSEGFGYTLAEAMMYEKPVICTNYGGVTDFATSETALLLDWKPRAVGPFGAPYPPDGTWAEPSRGQLVESMRWVRHHPNDAAEIGRAASRFLRERHSFAASGEQMRERLDAISRLLSKGYSPRAGEHPYGKFNGWQKETVVRASPSETGSRMRIRSLVRRILAGSDDDNPRKA